ncbi:MAG TPA: fumarylacetoacetate hydrolase family protein [Terriglobales bacterium]|nr:fumarylacetoacetate hydrolase family protein [Terriglobales bacterium]
MRYCRFQSPSGPAWGMIERLEGKDVITRLLTMPEDVASFSVATNGAHLTAIPLDQARLLAPVMPSKIIGVGRNYKDHAKELGNEPPAELLTFLKAPSTVIAPGATIVLPKISERVDYEGELGVIIGRRCRNLADDEDVKPYIRGYTCVNDVTARDLQHKDAQWTRAKGFDTFCPVGPIVTDDLDPTAVQVTTKLNGETKQSGNTKDFIFPVALVIRAVSRVMTLLPGDLITTGTPAGVGPMKPGDVVEVTIPGVGTLKNPVAAE